MKKLFGFVAAVGLAGSLFSFNAEAQNITDSTISLQRENTMSVLWFQTSGEAKALYYQGYNIGKMRLDDILRKKPKKKGLKPAVVLDIDETILDNSPYQAWNVLSGKAYPLSWDQWINSAQAKPLPGAIDFLNYTNKQGVDIFYISNRKEEQKQATIKNLQAVGAPQADATHVLLLQPGERGKEIRRQQVAKTHEILLLFGDNLSDFHGFDNLTVPDRLQAVIHHKEEFGKKLIVFPNPMYGDWEGAIYNYNYGTPADQKARLRQQSLMPYQP